ncbi:MAG: hypothetical protein KBE04_01875 [Phycisphaerae bacterium]|nr:hypothetical protein [Phycisphaerae bacterium]
MRSSMRRPVVLPLLAALASIRACTGAAEPIPVSVKALQPGAQVSRDLLGLSYETSAILPDANGTHSFRPDNRPLVTVFRTLGIRSLRIGGNSVDSPTIPVPDEQDVRALFEFARAAGVRVIYSVRLQESVPSSASPGLAGAANAESAARMAKLIHEHDPDLLDCFAIGNEPGYYKDYAVYSAKWKAIRDAILAVYPDAAFCGPDQNPSPDLTQRMVRDVGNPSGRLVQITQHSYPFGCSYQNPGVAKSDVTQLIPLDAAAARERMLSPAAYKVYEGIHEGIAAALSGTSVSYRLTETNTYWFSGLKGASDSYASALWALDYLHWWASHGADGLNFHTGDYTGGDISMPCRYAVWVTSSRGYEVRPLGYGMKMFDLGGHGRVLQVAVPPGANLAAYATLDGDTVAVTLIHKAHGAESQEQPVQIELDTSLADRRAQVLFLRARKDDIAGGSADVTLGGSPIQEDGTWNGRWLLLPSGAVTDHAITLTLAPASAAVVKAAIR